MKNDKKILFISKLFKDRASYFGYYFEYLQKIDVENKKILHLGCGWDKRNIKDRIKNARIYSLDIDFKALKKNVNSFKVCGDAHCSPFKNESFDSIICEDFIEHVEFPDLLLSQISLLLKEKGEFIFTTPGGWSYVSIVSKLTPLRFHRWYNKIRGVDLNDIYPAFYRFNSKYRIKKESGKYGFSVEKIEIITGYPSYFNFSKTLTLIFGLFHYFISKIKFLNNIFGINIFCVLKKR